MPQIPIISGIFASKGVDQRISYPKNMMPVPVASGVSDGYLRPHDGLVAVGTPHGTAPARGGICWDGLLYRVMGTELVRVQPDNTVEVLGVVNDGGPVSMAYSFDHLAVASGGALYLFDGATLTQVTDPDLGYVADVVWIDGYFMVTDGEFIATTDINDPFSISPTKYANPEFNPDPVVALLRLRGEVYALGRYTIEPFNNVGGDNFPFQRNEGGIVMKGALGPKACCVFEDVLAFVGSGTNEAPSVYLAINGQSQKIATTEIDRLLAEYTEQQLATSVMEYRNDNGHMHLYVHLPNRSLVYDKTASAALSTPVWFELSSSMTDTGQYRGRYMVWSYNRWQVADTMTSALGVMDQDVSTHWGEKVLWRFRTPILWNRGFPAAIARLELAAVTGRTTTGTDPTVALRWSTDGLQWSQPKRCPAGRRGERDARIQWRALGMFRGTRIYEFSGDSDCHIAVQRVEADFQSMAR